MCQELGYTIDARYQRFARITTADIPPDMHVLIWRRQRLVFRASLSARRPSLLCSFHALKDLFHDLKVARILVEAGRQIFDH